MTDILDIFSNFIKEELNKPEWKQNIIEPISKWVFNTIWPWALGIILINFFLTIGAVSLVLYFTVIRQK